MYPNKRIYYTVVACAVVALGIYFFHKPTPQFISIHGVVWTTEYSITYQGDKSLSDSVTPIFNAVDMSASMFNPKSIISRINAGDSAAAADRILRDLFTCSQEVYHASGGSYDPTVAPLVNAWGFGYKNGIEISQQAIDSIRQFVGLNKIEVSPQGTVIKADPRTIIDFSSIAKGYACDEIARMFKRNGVENFLIEIGGEIYASGHNSQRKDWHISIDKPIDQADSVVHNSAFILPLRNQGIATSGNYRNYKIVDGKRISHIINPSTGYPEQSSLLSATIIAPTAAEADAYATAAMVMGLDRSIKLIESDPDLLGILIYTDTANALHSWVSPNLNPIENQ